MRRLSLILFFLILSLQSLDLMAQNGGIKVQAPDQVQVGEAFMVTYVVTLQNTNNLQITKPSAGNLKQVYQTTQQSMSVVSINGKTTQELITQYIYTYVADREGSYVIEGFRVTDAQGAVHTAPKKSIRVTASTQNRGASLPDHTSRSKAFYEYRLEPDQTVVYEQEPIILTSKLYSTSRAISLQYGYQPPAINNFVSVLAPDSEVDPTFVQATYRGKPCYSAELSKMILYPTTSGSQRIDRSELPISVYVSNHNNPFLSEHQDVRLQSQPLSIEVKPLPLEGRPDDYCGAVGEFQIELFLNSDTLVTNKAFTYGVRITGRGDLRTSTLNMLKEGDIPGLEYYPPNEQFEQTVSNNRLLASKVHEYTVIPRKEGQYSLPAFSFTYFDTRTKSYRRLETKSLKISVSLGDTASEDLLIYGKGGDTYAWELSYRRGAKEYTGYSWVTSMVYLLSYVLLVALAYVGYLLLRRRLALIADTAQYNAKRAGSTVNRRLVKAHKLLGDGNHSAFYDETLRALWGYVQDKFVLDSERLNRATLRDELVRRGASEEEVQHWISTIDGLEFARFSSNATSVQPEFLYKQAEDAIAIVEHLTKQK